MCGGKYVLSKTYCIFWHKWFSTQVYFIIKFSINNSFTPFSWVRDISFVSQRLQWAILIRTCRCKITTFLTKIGKGVLGRLGYFLVTWVTRMTYCYGNATLLVRRLSSVIIFSRITRTEPIWTKFCKLHL